MFRGRTMGTTFAVTVVGQRLSVDAAEHLRAAIEDQLASLDAMMSTYDSGSEVSRFNAFTSSDWFQVSPETATVFLRAREISEVTGGAFDVTVGPLVDAWGFGPAGPQPAPPSDADIARLLTRVGFAQIEVDEVTLAIRKTHAGVRSDLSTVWPIFSTPVGTTIISLRSEVRFEHAGAVPGGSRGGLASSSQPTGRPRCSG